MADEEKTSEVSVRLGMQMGTRMIFAELASMETHRQSRVVGSQAMKKLKTGETLGTAMLICVVQMSVVTAESCMLGPAGPDTH